MDSEDVKNRVIEKLLRQNCVGAKYTQIDSVAAWFPSHQRDKVQETVEELLHDPGSPVENARGGRASIRLTNIGDAVEYLQSRDGKVPYGFGDKVSEKSDEDIQTPPANSEKELDSRISDLEEELQTMDQAAADWRSEARRRQRLSILFGVTGFVLGIITSGLFGSVV